jgi:hypothetical protein
MHTPPTVRHETMHDEEDRPLRWEDMSRSLDHRRQSALVGRERRIVESCGRASCFAAPAIFPMPPCSIISASKMHSVLARRRYTGADINSLRCLSLAMPRHRVLPLAHLIQANRAICSYKQWKLSSHVDSCGASIAFAPYLLTWEPPAATMADWCSLLPARSAGSVRRDIDRVARGYYR